MDKGNGIDASNIKTVTDLVTNPPSNIGQLRRVLGILWYYRRYVKGFSRKSHTLLDLLKKDNIKSSSHHSLEAATLKSIRNVNNMILTDLQSYVEICVRVND